MSAVAAVVVNYNAGEHLIACVDSLRAEAIDEIVVVDNGSTDQSLELLGRAYPDIAPLVLSDNPGFGAAVNRGVALTETQTVLCLNPDTVIHRGAVTQLSDALAREGVGVVGPMLLNSDGSLYPSARRFPSFTDAIGHALFGLIKPDNRWSSRYKWLDLDRANRSTVDWLSGSALLFSRKAFDQVGGFDASYWMYMEDVDICWRLGQAGWSSVYEPAAVVTHVQGVSTNQTPYRLIAAHHRSLLRYNLRSTKGPARLLLPIVVVGLAARVPVACAHRFLVGLRAAKGRRITAGVQS